MCRNDCLGNLRISYLLYCFYCMMIFLFLVMNAIFYFRMESLGFGNIIETEVNLV